MMNSKSGLKNIAFEEDKFIVINKKHLGKLTNKQSMYLNGILRDIRCENRYLAVNQDEPYAPKILAVILQEENLKQIRKIK